MATIVRNNAKSLMNPAKANGHSGQDHNFQMVFSSVG